MGERKRPSCQPIGLVARLAAEGLHHRRRDISVVVHYLPFPAFPGRIAYPDYSSFLGETEGPLQEARGSRVSEKGDSRQLSE